MTKKNPFDDDFLSRSVDFVPVSEERSDSTEGRTLEGYAAVFNEDTEINSWEGHFNERIAPGAFKKTLSERKPVMQFDHGHDTRFGSLPIGSFDSLNEDERGLYVKGELFDHAEPIRQAIKAGAVSGMSFRFKVVRDSWADKDGKEIGSRGELMDLLWDGKDRNGNERGPLQRTIKEVKLMEAGPVVFPAYPQTTVGVRSADLAPEQRERIVDNIARAMGMADAPDSPYGNQNDEPDDDNKCPKCGHLNPEDATQCEVCGASLNDSDGDEAKSHAGPSETTSVAPEAGTDAGTRETPDDAAQAGTSTGLSKNARERALRLLDLN